MTKKTFTIIEFVIVLAIVGALTALSVTYYLDSQQLSKMHTFEANINKIVETLNIYRSNKVMLGVHSIVYPTSISDTEFKALFTQEPINPYTGKSMLSSASADSGIQYQSDGTSYSICIAQQDVDDINNNGRIDDPLPVTSYPACTSTIQPPPSSEYVVTVVTFPSGGGTAYAVPNQAASGATITLVQYPASCYDFTSWTADVPINNNQFTMPPRNVIITANYTIKTYTVSAAPNNPSYGTVTGSNTYDCGSTATLTAVPNTGYTFVGWYEGSKSVTTATTYSFTVTGTRTLEARFAIKNITIAFTRNSVAYTSNGVQVGVNVPRFEQGKFGQAIMIEEGTTNLLLYSEDFTQSVWSKSRVDVSSAGTYLNYPVTRFTPNTPGQTSAITQTFLSSGAANRTFTWSFWARGQTNRQFRVNFYGGVSGTFASYAINLTTEWQKFTITHTFPSDATSARIQWGNVTPYWGVDYTDWIEVAGVQVEEKPYATSYIKTTSTTSTRSNETLTIPTAGVLNPQEGTIEGWVYVPQFWQPGIPFWRRIWSIDRGADAGIYLLTYNPYKGKIVFGIYNDAGTAQNISVAKPSVGWHYFAAKWSASEMALFIDGVKVGSIANPSLPSSFADTVISIGCLPDDPYDNVNTLIDDLRISSRARSDEEIAAAYASGQPAPVDANTMLKADFDGNLDAQSGIIQ